MPIVQAFDPSAVHLPNPPAPARVRALCDALRSLPAATDASPPPKERFKHLLHVLFSLLKRQAVYILVDSIDAHPETIHAPETATEWLRPLIDHFPVWAEQRVFPKLFLPEELDDFLKQDTLNYLTPQIKSAKIEWTPERLAEMLQARVRVASGGEFNSLDAVSSPALHRVEETLIAEVSTPRELLELAERVLLQHVRLAGPTGLLEPEDLEATIALFTSQNRNTEP